MERLSEAEVLELVRKALGDKKNAVTLDTQIGSVEAWDSLGHLSILTALDEALEGRTAEIEALAMARSVREIVDTLRSHELA
jgi:acyl carrier protein